MKPKFVLRGCLATTILIGLAMTTLSVIGLVVVINRFMA